MIYHSFTLSYEYVSWVPPMILQGRSGSFIVMDLNKCGRETKFKIFGEINTILGILATFCNKRRS